MPEQVSEPQGISRRLVLLLAVACGASVANLYYAQPLLHTLGHAFHVSNGTAGLLVTVTQVGYVIGLALLVPVGDLRERRTLFSALILGPLLGPLLFAGALSLQIERSASHADRAVQLALAHGERAPNLAGALSPLRCFP